SPMISPVFVVMLRGGMLAAVPTTSSPRCWIRLSADADDVWLMGALQPRNPRRPRTDSAAHRRDLMVASGAGAAGIRTSGRQEGITPGIEHSGYAGCRVAARPSRGRIVATGRGTHPREHALRFAQD